MLPNKPNRECLWTNLLLNTANKAVRTRSFVLFTNKTAGEQRERHCPNALVRDAHTYLPAWFEPSILRALVGPLRSTPTRARPCTHHHILHRHNTNCLSPCCTREPHKARPRPPVAPLPHSAATPPSTGRLSRSFSRSSVATGGGAVKKSSSSLAAAAAPG